MSSDLPQRKTGKGLGLRMALMKKIVPARPIKRDRNENRRMGRGILELSFCSFRGLAE